MKRKVVNLFFIISLALGAVFSTASSRVNSFSGWKWPLPAGTWTITQGPHGQYLNGCISHCDGSWVNMEAVDISTNGGHPNVLSVADGTVVQAYYDENWSSGNIVMILHDNGYYSNYLHLDSINVSQGKRVKQGDIIGIVGNSGSGKPPCKTCAPITFGVHLHFTVTQALRSSPVSLAGLEGYSIGDKKIASTNTAMDDSGNTGATPIGNPPSAPGLSTPLNNFTANPSSAITFKWNNSSAATAYYIEYWGGPYQGILTSGWIGDTEFKVGTLWEGTYFWRVKAHGDNGTSDWSDTWMFVINDSIDTTSTTTATTSNCSITSFNISPSSPQLKGTMVHITGSGSCGENSVRAMRFLVDGNPISEIGAPNLDTNWNTADFSAGVHTLELQVAKVGDNEWTNVGFQTKSFELTNSLTPTTTSSQKASCSITSFNISPSSPQNVGSSIHITGQAQCSKVEVRAMRLLVDGTSIYEIGAPNLDAYWKTGDYSSGSHTIELQVAGKGDNDWVNIGSQTKSFELTNAPIVSTATPNRAPSCSISSYSVSPSSPQSVGTPVHITASGTCGGASVRAMRILVDGSSIYEIGAPSIETNWNTNSFSEGNHQIDIQVAAVGDNNWSFSGNQSLTFNLTATRLPTIAPTPSACQGPTLSSPNNGQLLNSSSVSLSWNSLSGASSHKMEIWGGDFGGNHQAPCGWSPSTSCTINNLGKYNYMWRVLSKVNGQECASQEWNFTISY